MSRRPPVATGAWSSAPIGRSARWCPGGSAAPRWPTTSGVVVESDQPRRLSYYWHPITPEFGRAIEIDAEEVARLAAEPRSKVTFDREPAGELVELRVTHAGFAPGSEILPGISEGWPGILASLKTLLETGEPLPA